MIRSLKVGSLRFDGLLAMCTEREGWFHGWLEISAYIMWKSGSAIH
jgi:hypothetical protein